MSPRIVGVDLSLTSTGMAVIEDGNVQTGVLKPKSTGHERLAFIRGQVAMTCLHADLILVEGPSFGSGTAGREKGQHERGGLWWHVTQMLWESDRPWAVISPAQLKLYATGKGNASKDLVLIEVVKRFPLGPGFKGNDQADSLVLAAMGADHLGCPLVVMPQTHRAALAKVQWPAEVAF